MYVGRIVAIGNTQENQLVVMYRVSSRSFPNREVKVVGKSIAVVPRKGFETDIYKNPYISYNCLRIIDNFAVVSNGSHTDPITEKLESGMGMRDAMVSTLNGLDYEHDELKTPRIAAIVNKSNRICTLGTVRSDALIVQEMNIQPGEAYYLATYEHNEPSNKYRDTEFNVTSAEEACEYILGKGVFSALERPILAVCAIENDIGFTIAFKDVEQK
jgi:IMP cyclohydrolase